MGAIRKISAVDEVFEYLHRRIVSGEFGPGHRFPAQDLLAEELGVSRSTVREALNKLSLLGLLTAKPGVGTLVAEDSSMASLGRYLFLKSGEVTQFMEARLYLEKAAVRLAILKASSEDIARLSTVIAEQGQAVAQCAPDVFARLDAQFHRALIEIGRNEPMERFLGLIWDGLSQFIAEVCQLQSAMEHAFQFHCRLVKHLADRDRRKAEATILEHLQDVALNIERNLGRSIGLREMFELEREAK